MTFSCDQIIYVGVEMGQIGVGNIEWPVSSDKTEKNIISLNNRNNQHLTTEA